jgi:dihydropteroate synthase
MGVLNLTPDSFSDGGRCFSGGRIDVAKAVASALQLIDEGATIVDVGGESTRPGATAVGEAEELSRVLPVVERLATSTATLISVDTSSPVVMSAAIAAGAAIINDVRALRRPGALQAVARTSAGLCLMHMQGEPATMQSAPHYDDVIQATSHFLEARLRECEAAGIARERIALDPGFGFGKAAAHNLQLLAGLDRLQALGCPLLVGLSRKAILQSLTGRPVAERLAGSVALAALAVYKGARIVRAHDVAATLDAIKIAAALRGAQSQLEIEGG